MRFVTTFALIVFSLPTWALKTTSFFNRIVEVEPLDVKEPVRFYDVLSYDKAQDKATPLSPDLSQMMWHGICVSVNSPPCIQSYERRHFFLKTLARSLGKAEVSSQSYPQVKTAKASTSTTVKLEGKTLLLTTIKTFAKGQRYRARYRIHQLPFLGERRFDFEQPARDTSRRHSILKEGASHKPLAESLVQIARGPFQKTDLLGNRISSGTGFFISETGLLLTNHHVIASYPDCLSHLHCEITLRQINPEGKETTLKVQSQLYAESEGFDFALLKIDLPSHFAVRALEIEQDLLGSRLMTLGYPGDQKRNNNIDLTYSYGLLMGFNSRTFITSVYGYSGASGSPLLNAYNQKVIGIVSDVAGTPIKGRGTPIIARPIDIIDQEFQIRHYITGTKQARIDELIRQIRATSIPSLTKTLMDRYLNEKTLYGAEPLLQLMIQHKNQEIRQHLLQGLRNAGLVRGKAF